MLVTSSDEPQEDREETTEEFLTLDPPDIPVVRVDAENGIPSTIHQEEEESSSDDADTITDTNNSTAAASCWDKLTWLEISGSCGDFGTLIPLLVALARQRAIYLAPTLLWTGIVHILTGWYWDIPMPLQPMKAISAIAIAGNLTQNQVSTAGVGIGICFLLLQFNGGIAIDILHKWIPKSVIGGLQLGVGWKLAIRGIVMIQVLPWWFGSGDRQLDCIAGAILCSLLCLYWLRPRRTTSQISSSTSDAPPPPVGIYLFGVGVVLAAIQLATTTNDNDEELLVPPPNKEPLFVNALKDASWNDWTTGWLQGTLTQLPLTTLNSCLSVCLLAQTLYPNNDHKTAVSRRSVCLSIGLMNVLLCPIGCMPHCHGAGGLAGQHRLGATSGVSMIVLGVFKIGLSLVAYQGSLLMVLDALPSSILGVLLVLAGHELAITGVVSCILLPTENHPQQPHKQQQQVFISLVTALVIVGTGKTHVGALCGWLTYMVHGNGYQELCCGSGGDGGGGRGRRRAHGQYYSHLEQRAGVCPG